MKGIERRIEAGSRSRRRRRSLSLFVSRWDVAVHDDVPDELQEHARSRGRQGDLPAYRELLDSDRWQRLADEGARPQRLLFASTGTKDPEASDTLYIEAFAAPGHDQHDARQDPARPSPTTARSAIRCRPTAATARRSSRRTRTPASTPTRSG